MTFSGTLPVPPLAQPRPRLTSRGGKPRAYEPPKATAWKAGVAALLKIKMRKQGVTPFVGPVSVSLAFNIRSKKQAHETREDVDNLCKSFMDAATQAGVWADDRQVTLLRAQKHAVVMDGSVGFIIEEVK